MLHRDYTDVVGGLILLVAGLVFSWFAIEHYNLGTIRRMGPGMFPASLGIILAFFGLLMVVPALFRPGPKPSIRLWSPLFVLLGIGAFALLVQRAGLIPATVAITVISSMAELKVRPISLIALSAVLCAVVWLTFSVALGLPIAMLRWPF